MAYPDRFTEVFLNAYRGLQVHLRTTIGLGEDVRLELGAGHKLVIQPAADAVRDAIWDASDADNSGLSIG